MDRVRSRATAVVALFALAFGGLVVAGAPAQATTQGAVAWLKTQQQADGGFEVAGFPGFETADAAFAIASHAQTGAWSTTQARDAVLDTQTASHLTALNELDNLADSGNSAGQAAKLIVLVTNPLGFDPNRFDPDCDGGSGVDLQARLGSPGAGGTYGISIAAFNQVLFAARATKVLGGTVAAATITVIRNAQRPDGSFAFNGSPVDDPDPNAFDDSDVDTTANAVQAMLAAGLAPSDTTLAAALAWMATQRNAATGAYKAFGSDDPNSTAVAMLALNAVNATTYASELTAGDTFLLSQQQVDGHVASPNDFGPPSTFATSQAIQALDRATVPAGGTGGVAACTDGNLDGISDADQPAVETVPAAAGTGYITIEANGDGVSLAQVEPVDPASEPAPPTGVTLPNGLVRFEVHGVATGETVTVQVRLHDGSAPTHYYKLRRDGTWLDFTSHATFAGSVVTLTLKDGGAGDDDPADGVIADPGGPASVVAAAVPGQTTPTPAGIVAAVGVQPDFTG